MHYKNGRKAESGDYVVGKLNDGRLAVGAIHSLSAASQTCNARLAMVVPGGVEQEYITVSEFLHAEDTFPKEAGQPKAVVTINLNGVDVDLGEAESYNSICLAAGYDPLTLPSVAVSRVDGCGFILYPDNYIDMSVVKSITCVGTGNA